MKINTLIIGLTILCSACIQKKSGDSPPKFIADKVLVSENDSYIKELTLAGEYMYAFSKIAEPGKVTLFITSTDWCAPCKVLISNIESAFQRNIINPKNVDVYVLKMHGNIEELNQQAGYKMLKEIDLLTQSFPTTYICSPTTNCFNVIKGNKFDEIIDDIKFLVKAKREFFDERYLMTSPELSSHLKSQDDFNYPERNLNISPRRGQLSQNGYNSNDEGITPYYPPSQQERYNAPTTEALKKRIAHLNRFELNRTEKKNVLRLVIELPPSKSFSLEEAREILNQTQIQVLNGGKNLLISNDYVSFKFRKLSSRIRDIDSYLDLGISKEESLIISFKNPNASIKLKDRGFGKNRYILFQDFQLTENRY